MTMTKTGDKTYQNKVLLWVELGGSWPLLLLWQQIEHSTFLFSCH